MEQREYNLAFDSMCSLEDNVAFTGKICFGHEKNITL
jgi:hypothetical protein